MKILTVSLDTFSALHIGGTSKMVVVHNEVELQEAVMYAKTKGLRAHILGGGTNTYFGDTLVNFLVIKNEILGIEIRTSDSPTPSTSCLTAGSGENWDDIVKYATKKNLWGIENLSLIPGTIGAAPVQNIGAYGVELNDVLVSVRAYDTHDEKYVELTNEQCEFGYRDSIFKHQPSRYVIVSVTLKLSSNKTPILTYKPLDSLKEKNDVTVEEIRNFVIQTRTAKLPDYNLYPNTGSFFKNPVVTLVQGEALRATYGDLPLIPHQTGYKIPAAWLIEHVAHMKGARVGDIGTWPTQPLVIVNYGNATATEINRFSEEIIKKIYKETGIALEKEVNYVGDESQ